MKYSLAPTLLASPAIAHDGVHLNPHDGSTWMVVAALLGIAATVALFRYVFAEQVPQ